MEKQGCGCLYRAMVAGLMLVICLPGYAQGIDQSLAAVSTDGNATDTVFTVSVQGVSGNSSNLHDPVTITATIDPDAGDTGAAADIFMVMKVNGRVTVRQPDGQYLPLTGGLAGLVPARRNVILGGTQPLEVFSGALDRAGRVSIFLGYQLADSQALVYSPRSVSFDVIDNTVTPDDEPNAGDSDPGNNDATANDPDTGDSEADNACSVDAAGNRFNADGTPCEGDGGEDVTDDDPADRDRVCSLDAAGNLVDSDGAPCQLNDEGIGGGTVGNNGCITDAAGNAFTSTGLPCEADTGGHDEDFTCTGDATLPPGADGSFCPDSGTGISDDNTKVVTRFTTNDLSAIRASGHSPGAISAPLVAVVDEVLAFRVDAGAGGDWTWDFGDGTSARGDSVSHVYSEPTRYRVTASRGDVTEVKYLDVGRDFADTIYPLVETDYPPSYTQTRDFEWNDCDAGWAVYLGKYHRLWVEDGLTEVISPRQISLMLALSDYLFDAYSAILGWSYQPPAASLDTYICNDIPGGGTGTGGTFYNQEIFTPLDDGTIRAVDFSTVMHEMLHLWDFRGDSWLSSGDTAHAFTGGMEPVMNHVLGMGGNMTVWFNWRDLMQLPPDFVFNHYFRIAHKRYLDHPELDWETYNADEFLGLAYERLPMPEHKEHMLVPGGILMSVYNMHGIAGLQSVFRQLDELLFAQPEWLGGVHFSTGDKRQRVQNVVDAMAAGLQLDVSDYFDYWKYPAVDTAVTGRYPKSDMLVDHDGDGVSPLQGDRDDRDSSVYPYAEELMDGKDNNQDGLVDEYVYDESGGDIGEVPVTLPAAMHGTISDLSDTDSFTITLSEPGWVTFSMYAKDSDTAVEYEPGSGREVSVFQGSVWLDDEVITELLHEAMSAAESLGVWYLDAGSHTLTITTETHPDDPRNGNPGDYEIQAFINAPGPGNTIDALVDVIYP